MTIPSTATPSGARGAARPDESPEAAAAQFEAVLVRQFVEVMTKDLFDSEEEGMLTGQADLQRDTLTDALTDHLVESGTFGIADLLMRQWHRDGRLPADGAGATAVPAPATNAPPAGAPAPRPMTLDDALRLYPDATPPSPP